MPALDESIDDLKYFVAGFFDGSLERCFDLDQLLWEVRRAADKETNKHEFTYIEAAPPKLLKKLDLADIGL